ncbi:MAG: GNAT family N-acetyltransferase [Anaerolineae bacterium]|nr:GNAT family N-acetyltransferase [Anaerolineae bacterium]
MTFEIVRTLDKDIWREYLNQNPDANIFHSPEFFDLLTVVKGYEPQLWAAVNQAGQPLALLTPVEVTLMDGIMSRLTTRLIAYGGLLYTKSDEGRAALAALLQAYTKSGGQGALFTELRNLVDMSDVDHILQRHGFELEGHLNYLINLNRPAEDVMQSIGKRTRKQIRRGLRQAKVVVSEVSRRDELGEWFELLQRTYSAAQVPLSDSSLFEAAFDILHPYGMIKLMTARVEDKLVSCSAELIFKDIIYGWYSGTDRAYASFVPNELLMWNVLEWGVAHDYRVYDFGGAGKPDEEYGVRDFKAKFGGDLVNYGRHTFVHSPKLLKLSKQGYELYRRFL